MGHCFYLFLFLKEMLFRLLPFLHENELRLRHVEWELLLLHKNGRITSSFARRGIITLTL